MISATTADSDAPAIADEPGMIARRYPNVCAPWRFFKAPDIEGLLGRVGTGVLMRSVFIKFLITIRDQGLAVRTAYPLPGQTSL